MITMYRRLSTTLAATAALSGAPLLISLPQPVPVLADLVEQHKERHARRLQQIDAEVEAELGASAEQFPDTNEYHKAWHRRRLQKIDQDVE